jgi:hypothetical protein
METDNAMAINARLEHAREKASGTTPKMAPLNSVPITARRKANPERMTKTFVRLGMTHLLISALFKRHSA